MDSFLNVFLWLIFPYICLTIFVLGHVGRYRYDKFGWTSRSSQMYEGDILRWANPMFHFGFLAVFLGHVMGLGIPKAWTEAVGISEGMYHFLAISIGVIAGVFTIVGFIGLVYRRRFTKAVLGATTPMDKLMYLVLGVVIILGLVNTGSQVVGEYDYREGVSIWFRTIFYFNPQPDLMVTAPLSFQLRYIFRPYVLYRTRDPHEGSRARRRGWDKVDTIPRRR